VTAKGKSAGSTAVIQRRLPQKITPNPIQLVFNEFSEFAPKAHLFWLRLSQTKARELKCLYQKFGFIMCRAEWRHKSQLL